MRILLFLLICLLLAFPCEAVDESKSFILLKAQKGDAEAQRIIGLGYLHGRMGLRLDCTKAKEWLLKAAKQKDITALQYLSYLYNSSVCQHDPEKVEFWLQEAATVGNGDAQWILGERKHDAGKLGEAVYWLERSAKQGNQFAQFSLAKIYEKVSRFTPEDYITAYAWYSVSAAMGNKEAKDRLLGMEFVMGPEEEAKAKQLAIDYQKALAFSEVSGQ